MSNDDAKKGSEQGSVQTGGRAILWTVACGAMMGGADVVPGVSGGTVALVLGIYLRLIAAISRFDTMLFDHLRSRRWRAALAHVDGVFLVSLAAGIGIGVIGLGIFMHDLLGNPTSRTLTLAAFFGLIVGSCILVGRTVRARSTADTVWCIVLGAAAAAAAFLLTLSTPMQVEQPSTIYLFVCGMIAICAMILPGISGAYVLVILGVYTQLTDILKGFRHMDVGGEQVLTLLTVMGGCVIGLLGFSRVLRWLLSRFHDRTMAVLCGFMIGALPKIWPFQRDLTPDVVELKHKQFEPVIPHLLDAGVLGAIAVGLLGLAFVLGIHYLALWNSRRARHASL